MRHGTSFPREDKERDRLLVLAPRGGVLAEALEHGSQAGVRVGFIRTERQRLSVPIPRFTLLGFECVGLGGRSVV